MHVKINYKKTYKNKANSNLVIFTEKEFNTNSFKNKVTKNEFLFINELLKNSNVKENFLDFQVSSKKKNNISFLKEEPNKFRCRKFRCQIL